MVLSGHAGFHGIDEELIEPLHRRAVEDQLAVGLDGAAEGQVELPIIRAVRGARIEAVTRFDQTGILDLLRVFENVLQRVFAGLHLVRQRIDIGI